MISDDVIYLSLLISCIGFGEAYRKLKDSETRKWVGTCVGLLVALVVSGVHILHPLFLTATNIAILLYVDKSWCHVVSFFWSFFYLFFFRICHYVGLEMPPAHTNAILMMVTLKLVGVCYEVHDTWEKRGQIKKEEDEEAKAKLMLELKYEEVDPTPADIFHYAFNYIGVLTGPYYKYRVYADMLHLRGVNSGLNCLQAMLSRIWVVPIYSAAFLITSHFFPLSTKCYFEGFGHVRGIAACGQFAENNEIFTDYSFMYRVWYMTPVFFTFRMRIYSGFVLSECVCIMAGLGAYPKDSEPKPGRGPSNYEALEQKDGDDEGKKEFNFETIHNIDEYGADFTPTVRAGMRCWNMTVQYWLASNVYKRLKLARPVREALTMLTSAYWHGVYSGYYLSMLTVPFILAIEDYFDRLVRRRLGDTGQKWYDWFSWFVKMQNFAYMGMAFLLLRVNTTLHYWHSIGYIYHGLIILMHGVAQYVNLIMGKAEYKLKKARRTAIIDENTKMVFKGTKEVVSGQPAITADTPNGDTLCAKKQD